MREWGELGERKREIDRGLLVVRGPRAIGFRLTPRRVVPDPHASRAQPGRAPSCLIVVENLR